MTLARARRAGRVGGATLFALAIVAPHASAAGSVEDVQSTLVAISVMSLPITGLLVLLLLSMTTLLGRPSRSEPAAFHVTNLVVVVALLSFLGALLVPFVFVEGVSTTLTFAAVGVLDLLLVAGVFARYLLFRVPWAVVAGGVVATISVAWAAGVRRNVKSASAMAGRVRGPVIVFLLRRCGGG